MKQPGSYPLTGYSYETFRPFVQKHPEMDRGDAPKFTLLGLLSADSPNCKSRSWERS
jgi:hypothetical protein